jgi:acyl dehydratase
VRHDEAAGVSRSRRVSVAELAIGTMYLEDFRPGQVFRSDAHIVTEQELLAFADISGDLSPLHTDEEYAKSTEFGQRILHGPYGVATFLGALYRTHTVETTAVALLDTNWRYLQPIVVGDELVFEITITRCRRTSDGARGVVGRHIRLTRADGTILQEGTSSFLVLARDPTDAGQSAWAGDFCGRRWSSELAKRLGSDLEFRSSTQAFDGTIGLQCGSVGTQLRIYAGSVLEAVRRTPRGPTFSIGGTELAWTQVAVAERNPFVQMALRNDFSISGDVYEYLRMTKAVMRVWECARDMAAETWS